MFDSSAQNNPADSGNQNVVYEGFAVRSRKAPFWPRLLAYLTDISIVTVVLYLGFIVLAAIGAFGAIGLFSILDKLAPDSAESVTGIVSIVLIVVLILAVFGVFHGYFVYNEYKKGTTPGKRIFGLRVVSVDGGKLTLGQCMLRDFLRLIDCQLLIPGFLSIQLSEDGKRLGDMVAGTQVVYSRSKEQEMEFTYVQPEVYHYYFERFSPKPIPAQAAKEYLTYSYGQFITGKTPTPQTIEWADQVCQQFLTIPEELNLSSHDIRLFFAEFCHQSLNQVQAK